MKCPRRNSILACIWLAALLLTPLEFLIAQNPSDLNTYQQAVKLFKEASQLAERGTDPEKRTAIEKFLAAAKILNKLGRRDDEANAINAAANVYDDLQDDGEAVGLFLQVADILHETGDRQNLAITLSRIGAIYAGGGQKAKALEYFNVGLAIRRELKDEDGEATVLNQIGSVYDTLGERQNAIDNYNRALAIRKRIGDREGVMITLGNLGVVYISLGENQKALSLLDEAMKLARELGDKSGEASILHNVASIYDALGDSRRALENYNRSLELSRSVGDKSTEGDTLNNIGAIYVDMGDPKKALDYFDRAAKLRLGVNNLSGAIETLINFGFAHAELGDKAKALEIYNLALPLTRKAGDRSAEAETLHNIGFLYEGMGQHLKAIDYYDQALPIRRIVSDKPGEARTLSNMMVDWNRLGNFRLATLYGKQAINKFQEMRSAIGGLDADVRKRYLSSIESTYRDLANILIENGRIAEAEEVLGMLKEEEIFAFQRRDDKIARELLQTSTLNENERTAIAGYERIAEQITAIAKEYGDLNRERLEYPVGKFPKQARLDELDRQRADAILSFQKYLDQLKVEFAKTAKDKEVAMVDSSLQETLREMKAERTAVVSTIAGNKRLNIIVTTADVQRAHAVDISEAELNKLVGNFRIALTSPTSGRPVDPRPAGQKLYDILVKPIEGDLAGIKADTIVWSLDGSLRYLPTAALWDKQKGYLAERYANAVITLASRDRLLLPPSGKKEWTALGAGVSAPTEGFGALAAVPDELDCIVTDPVTKAVSANPVCLAGVLPGQKLLDDKFDERAFRSAIGRYSILHLASHFKLVPGNDNDSFLLLGGGEDRRFTVNKLNTVSLAGVELLALSACNTATPGGAKASGVEIEGFGAVAQKRGARSVMATLWPVADPSTRDFMVEFYRRFGAGNETKAASIRQAQLTLMRGSYESGAGIKPPRAETFSANSQAAGPPFEVDKKAPYAHPYYWAPFILFGNWR